MLLRVGDDVHTHQNSRILANQSITILGDFANADTGDDADEFGSTMLVRGEVTADCDVVSQGDDDQTGYPVALCNPNGGPVPGFETHIWGHVDTDVFTFGDETGINPCPGGVDTTPGCELPGSDGYYKLGSKTTVHGSPDAESITR